MIQGNPESVKSVLMPDGWLFFPSPPGTREVSAFSPIYNKVEESGRILSLADGIWPDLSHDGWNETESVRTGLWPVSARHKTGDRRNPARQCINFIVMYVETKSVCLQKYEFSYDIDEKHILKNAMGCRSLPKCPVSLLPLCILLHIKVFFTRYEAMPFHEDCRREQKEGQADSSGCGIGMMLNGWMTRQASTVSISEYTNRTHPYSLNSYTTWNAESSKSTLQPRFYRSLW